MPRLTQEIGGGEIGRENDPSVIEAARSKWLVRSQAIGIKRGRQGGHPEAERTT